MAGPTGHSARALRPVDDVGPTFAQPLAKVREIYPPCSHCAVHVRIESITT
jgi:hypothetical protein